LGQAAKGAQAAYLMTLLEERYPTSGSQREETKREAVREARIAATAALLLLKEGGSVPSYLQDLIDPAVRERERERYRQQARRARLSLLPEEDKVLRRKRALRSAERGEPQLADSAGLPDAPSRHASPKNLLAEASSLLSSGMARLSLSQVPDPHLRSELAPAVLAAHRLEISLILDQMASGLELFLKLSKEAV
jgi:hypothetical protein